jgi:ribosomal-protein-alanine N-acetyltransferase
VIAANFADRHPERVRSVTLVDPGIGVMPDTPFVDFALASGQVQLVRAHTLPEVNASTRVLLKCGFRHVGTVVDPDDGPVWRWELSASR